MVVLKDDLRGNDIAQLHGLNLGMRFIVFETILGYSFVFVHAMLYPDDQSRRV